MIAEVYQCSYYEFDCDIIPESGGGGGGGGATGDTSAPSSRCNPAPTQNVEAVHGAVKVLTRNPDEGTGPGSGGGTGGGGTGGSGGTSGGTPGSCDPIADILNKIKDKCLHDMVQAAIDRNIQYNLTQSMNSIFGKNTKFNLSFADAVLRDGSNNIDYATDGKTDVTRQYGVYDQSQNRYTELKGMDIEITLNNAALSNASQEFVTATILHEALHAYFRNSQSVLDHETMVSQYIPWFTGILHNLYPNISSLELAGLAYGGLMQTVGFQTSASQSLIDYYIQVNDNYKHSVSGTPCH